MVGRSLTLMVASLWALTAAAASPGVMGEDDRRPLPEADPALDAVGRVNRDGGGFCTGTLIGADRVLTAAHCLWDPRARRLIAPERVHFVAGWRRGRHTGHAVARTLQLDPALAIGPGGRPADPLTDWAVLRLATPLAGPALWPMRLADASELAAVAPGTVLARIGYGRDRPHLPVLVEPCRALGVARAGRLLLHDCDATLGDSGSPILLRTSGGYAVVAVATGLAHTAGGMAGTAVLIDGGWSAIP
jgi:protease YdgD